MSETAEPDYGMPVHPVCDLFPLIGGNEFQTLGDDIRANGLVHPIVVHEGRVVDGRNRLLACQDVGVEPRYVEWRQIYKGAMTLAKWIWSINVERRHLTLDQITAVQVGINAWEEQEAARKRQAAGKSADGTAGGRAKKKNLVINRSQGFSEGASQASQQVTPKPEPSGRVRAKLAKELGVSERKIQQAMNVQKADPELLKHVGQGATTLRAAEKQVKAKPGAKRAVVRKRAFNLERAIRKVMRVVDSALEAGGEQIRARFLAELIQTLEAIK